jgi:hypothetical protein
MRAKLTLNLEDLSVDTFDTTAAVKQKGTVFGEQCTCYTQCTCPGCPSCDATCPATCAYTCDDESCGGGESDYTCFSCGVSCNETECGKWCNTLDLSYCGFCE